jgi:antirestriction protein ArdC
MSRAGRREKRGIIRKSASWTLCRYRHNGHATGHPKRLNRDSITQAAPFGSAIYSAEEVLAEMTAAYLCGMCGIANRTVDNSAAYIAGWLGKLRDDPKLIVHAAAQAQKAAEFILGRQDPEN